ncbi:MAG: hypothetical protein GX610_08690 [Rhodococcus sp.]|nr:hypothetical protein [Rhodococcus sp. (in: high G+C Gram-positive bacteria)]
MTATAQIPAALTMQTNDLPWAHGALAPGLSIQLFIADIEGGMFVVKTRFQPGTVIPTHMHTGVTDAIFIIHGALVNLDEDGNVIGTVDATGARDLYFGLLEAQGDPRPRIIVGGNCNYSS